MEERGAGPRASGRVVLRSAGVPLTPCRFFFSVCHVTVRLSIHSNTFSKIAFRFPLTSSRLGARRSPSRLEFVRLLSSAAKAVATNESVGLHELDGDRSSLLGGG